MVSTADILKIIVKKEELELFASCLSVSKSEPFQRFWKKVKPCKVILKIKNTQKDNLIQAMERFADNLAAIRFENYITIQEFVETKKGTKLVTLDFRSNSSWGKNLEFFKTMKDAEKSWNDSIKEIVANMDTVLEDGKIKRQQLLNEAIL